MSVLNIQAGPGEGDIMKFYYGKVDFVIGIESDNNAIISPVDGALSRYNQLKKTHVNFPRMSFINADASIPLNFESQIVKITNMSEINKKLLQTHFGLNSSSNTTKFDRILCQYAVSDFLEDQVSFNNFMQNVCKHLKPGGYFIMTTEDADVIYDLLDNDKGQHTTYFTTLTGEQKVLLEIVRKYDNKDISKADVKVGVPIDYHNAFESQEGVYVTKYLVKKDYIVKQFKELCNLELVETDLFENQYKIHKEFFTNSYKSESVQGTLKFFTGVADYYNLKSDVNTACKMITKLFRFYVFRMKDSNSDNSDKSSKSSKSINIDNIDSDTAIEPEIDSNVTEQATSDTDIKPNKVTKAVKAVKSKSKSIKSVKSKSKKGGSIQTTYNYTYTPFNTIPTLLNPLEYYTVQNFATNIPQVNQTFMGSVHNILYQSDIIPYNVSLAEFCSSIQCTFTDNDINRANLRLLNKNINIKYTFQDDQSSEEVLNGINIFVLCDSCDGPTLIKYNYTIRNKLNPSILLYKTEANQYYPIYELRDSKYVGLYNTAYLIKKFATL